MRPPPRLCASLAAALVALVSPARADEPTPAPAARMIVPRDYDAADPDRGPIEFARAAVNMVLTDYLVWQLDWLRQAEIYLVTRDTLGENFRHGFQFDDDGLTTNLFAHPYHGGLLFAGARSAGLNFWESAPYAFGGSFLWELTSERQLPSTNDLVVTSLGGVAIGEMFYRLSSLVLDDSQSGAARLWRELGGAFISPIRGLNRAATGDASASGPPPVRKPAKVDVQFGLDRVRSENLTRSGAYPPSALFGLEVEYGDLLPRSGSQLAAYEHFDLYAAGIISQRAVAGVQLSTLGLLHGFGQDICCGEGDDRDNNVFGFVQSIDFQGADVLKFGAFGVGVGDYLVVRYGHKKRVRLQADLQWMPLAGVSSPYTPYAGTASDRDYNFTMGGSTGLGVRWDIGRLGQLALRTRHYGMAVVDGTHGTEIIGYARASYEIDLWEDHLGVGVAPTLVYRAGPRVPGGSFEATQLTNQIYFEVKP